MANNLIKEFKIKKKKKKKNGVFPVWKVYCLFAFPLFVEIKEQTSSGPDIQKCSCVFYNAVPEFLVHFQSGTNWAISNRTIEISLLSCFASKADSEACTLMDVQQVTDVVCHGWALTGTEGISSWLSPTIFKHGGFAAP